MIHTITDAELLQFTSQVAQRLLAVNWRLSVSESCTGGWLGKCCTDLAGSSTWFERGFITYSNQAKQDLLHVKESTIQQFGAVSEQTASEMVQGALAESMADISVAITGVAGPDGGTIDKPVGTVWFAWVTKYSVVKTQCCHFEGDRESIRRQAVKLALQGIIKNARD
ncbi:MAG: nicotinamide-nucleotide amidohydrolase family protein [Pseudomonadota bacterium]|nr:nicotinamide-nucleotide amidohydrolase family protein [Pseudomonadota bacterium]MDO7667002.1 nicotinamide-nucleotide amidohydrolase family protein [Pseudomonadota bacterium]MDO7711873.1 nicotinamide-nucleotide amidohydrolase family protein [Pseudomonadota bacterium]